MENKISDTQEIQPDIQDTQRSLGVSLDAVQQRINEACSRSGRSSSDITLVAVSKKQPVEKVQAFLDLCVSRNLEPVLGENYVQEFKKKREALKGAYKVHALGPLQSNKIKDAVSLFDCIESIHSFEILEGVNAYAARCNKVQDIFLQVNVSADGAKSGFTVEEARSLIGRELLHARSVRCRGLMTITKAYENPTDARHDFRVLRDLQREISALGGGIPSGGLQLSMGMSSDFEVAIEEGATIIRVGTALFGEREYASKVD